MSNRGLLSLRGFSWVVVIVLAGSLATAAAVMGARAAEEQAAVRATGRRAELTAEVVRGEVLRYQETLSMIAAALSAQQDLQREGFDTITRPLLDARLRGAAGIGFWVSATAEDTSSVESLWRRRGAAGLTLRPAGPGPEHVYSVFSRSLDGRAATIGRDVTSSPKLAQTLRLVSGTHRIAVSEPYVLFKDQQLPPEKRQLSLVLAAPVMDPSGQRQRGWVSMGLRAVDLLAQTLQQTGQDALNATITTIRGGRTLPLVNQINGPASRSALIRRISFPIGQRTWTLSMQGTDSAFQRDTGDGELGKSVLIGGFLITALLGGLIYQLSTSRQRALRAVDLATAELRQANERSRFAFEQAQIGMAVLDLHPDRLGAFLQVNTALCAILGYSSEDLLRRTSLDLSHPDDQQAGRDLLTRASDGSSETVKFEKRFLHASGRTIWAQVSATTIRGSAGRPAYAVAHLEDITARRAEKQLLSAMALQDPLTGLGNRTLFQDHMTQAVARAARTGNPLGVIYCDLNRFKEINDNYGHAAGDTVLRAVADRLRETVRPSDTVARLGGDEFVVLCEDLHDQDALQHVTQRIGAALQPPITLYEGTTVHIGCSFGTATGSGNDIEISTLLHEADLAMYQNKHTGRTPKISVSS